jgi:hypothetical protein
MNKVIANASMINSSGSAAYSYSIYIYLSDDGLVRGSTIFQRQLGGAASAGVELKCTFNAFDAIENLTMENLCAKIANEANKIIEKKKNAGYSVLADKYFDPVTLIKAIYEAHRAFVASKKSEPVEDVAVMHESAEVIGMVAGVATIAKVMSDFSYKVLGVLDKHSKTAIKIGDVVQVKKSGGSYQLVA